MGSVFLEVAKGASDAPSEKQTHELGVVLYGLHLAILLYWFHDKTPDGRATRELVSSTRQAIRFFRPALRLPSAAQVLSRLTGDLVAVGIEQ